ncbi:mannosyl-glycoprotein endo-beta-N-acetylglucosaminidase [Evansella caseinilytica]|uniref:Mannosyl-glycoprotein endo-beta-N-acetylglucosaminidase n=1 Tax=Evansella caseinilytica TaxID=1503961 RepID=A0A1H3TZ03_9BACI|nr:peptidoglycan-binding protein [Evansella caseinilytica]SDZ55474.1 mannosyl-glycoprotein endo-beta-N-acetylglucosaminidase [Evansella caseinilytica]
MKKRMLMILVIFIFSLSHFSPYIAMATNESINSEEEIQEEESLDENEANSSEKQEEIIEESTDKTTEKQSNNSEKERSGESSDEKVQSDDNDDKADKTNNISEEENTQSNVSIQQSSSSSSSVSFQNGDKDPRIVELKINLGILGFHVSNNPNQNFGPATEQAVKDFQQYFGLPVTGIADERTFAKIDEILASPFRNGRTHADVIPLKENLSKLGFHVSNSPNTSYGPTTERKVREFQNYYGLVENGIADEITLAKIAEILSTPFRNGQSHEDVISLKENLSKLGFHVSDNPNTAYGPTTERKVREFQDFYGLVENGIADEITLAKMEELLNTPMERGSYRKDVVLLKENLDKIGFSVSTNPTPQYGPATEQAVKDFQKYFGLSVTGIADAATLQKIETVLSSPLRNGQSHEDVITLKENLSLLGFHVSDNPNTAYGPTTERKVREFQSYYGLVENGIVDERTLAKITEILSSPFRNGQSHADVISLKENLSRLGFHVSDNPNTAYGPTTERKVREFQSYYGLVENGIADERTLAKIAEILSSPFRNGQSHADVIPLKENLSKLGFHVSNNPNTSYGPKTEEMVKEFQKYYGLVENGIADDVTLAKIAEILSSPLRRGQSHKDVIQLKKDLSKLGFHVSNNPNESYGPSTEQAVRSFQETYGLRVSGIADYITLNLIEELLDGQLQISYTDYNYTVADMVGIQIQRSPRTDLYSQKIAYVSSEYINRNGSTGTVTASSLNVRLEPNTGSSNGPLGTLKSSDSVTIIGTEKDTNPSTNRTWYAIVYNHGQNWQFARRESVAYYVNPDNFSLDTTSRDIYQYLVLSEASGVSVTYLNNELKGKGILEGRGQTFSNAAKQYSINEFYLLSHAILETGNGSSVLANGSIRVGKISSNKWVTFLPTGTFTAELNGSSWTIEEVKNFDESKASNIKTIYNMFGIGAVDSNPHIRGAIRAYEEQWFTANAAITGGTKFIAVSYIHHPLYKQDTLYKMRWNPGSPGIHQYATDIGWAYKQTSNLFRHYQELSDLKKTFDIPNFK